MTLTNKAPNPHTRGSYAIAESLGKVVGNPLVGYFKQRTGGYKADSLIFASMSGAAVILCLLISIVDTWRGGTLNDRGNLHIRDGTAQGQSDTSACSRAVGREGGRD